MTTVKIEDGGMTSAVELNETEIRSHVKEEGVLADVVRERGIKAVISDKEKSIISSETRFYRKSAKILCDINERVVIFRMGRIRIDENVKNGGLWGPGTVKYYPAIDTGNRASTTPIKIDKRGKKEQLEDQQIITLDGKLVQVKTTIVYVIANPVNYLLNSDNPVYYTKLLFQSYLRDIATRNSFKDLCQHKKKLCEELKKLLATSSIKWGIRIELIDMELKDLNKRLKPSFTTNFMASVNDPTFQMNINTFNFNLLAASNPLFLNPRTLAATLPITVNPAMVMVPTMNPLIPTMNPLIPTMNPLILNPANLVQSSSQNQPVNVNVTVAT